ncbi:MAG TPA: hypothetical protein PLN13_10520 [Bacteroidia bacterium]|nr:hypothetical protein [Bacteroidia bacterium]HRH09004.1 hypothetical protein [Bacteroidia bacterium]
MSSNNKLLFGFIAGAAAGILAATLLSKEDRDKIAAKLKDKAGKFRDKIASELADTSTKDTSEKSS